MDLQKVSIQKIGDRAILKVGNDSVEIQNFKISSSMRGGTELEVTFQVESCEVMEFELGAKKEAFQPLKEPAAREPNVFLLRSARCRSSSALR